MADDFVYDKKSDHLERLLKEWASGGLANAITSTILNPMDVTKTRMQTIVAGSHSSIPRTNVHLFTSTFRTLYHEGGLVGLWSPGLLASCIREIMSSGPRAGFYVPVRDAIKNVVTVTYNVTDVNNSAADSSSDLENSFLVKALAAMMTGTMGSILANPIDVVKIRLMTNPKAYPSTIGALPEIMRSEGLAGLYKGVVPSTLRGAFIAAGELATYDHSKHLIKHRLNLDEGFQLHSLASLVTGFVAATVAAPFDMIKTRTMNSQETQARPLVIFREILQREGPLALFRGWTPSYLRLGPHAMICFPIFEQLRRLLGLDYL